MGFKASRRMQKIRRLEEIGKFTGKEESYSQCLSALATSMLSDIKKELIKQYTSFIECMFNSTLYTTMTSGRLLRDSCLKFKTKGIKQCRTAFR